MTLFGLLADIVGRLDRAGIPHMVAGSLAGSFHGEPRATRDVDLVIDPTPEALPRFVADLGGTGYYVGDALAALARRDVFNVVDPATGWKVDLIVIRDRPFSRSEFERRQAAELGGVQIFLATAEDTILAKLEWARLGESERQRQDVAGIVAVNASLDVDYLMRWAVELGVEKDLRGLGIHP